MEEIRKHFPALRSGIYLNTASTGLVPKPVIDWRRAHDLDLMNHRGVFSGPAKAFTGQIRQSVARFFEASVLETALVPNFSFGINMVLDGLPEGQKRSEEHTSELQSRPHLVCRLLLEKKKTQ